MSPGPGKGGLRLFLASVPSPANDHIYDLLAFYKFHQTAAKGTAEPWDVCADGSFPRCPNGNRDTCPFHIRKCADRSLTISSFFWKQGHKSLHVLLENVQIIDPFYCGETF